MQFVTFTSMKYVPLVSLTALQQFVKQTWGKNLDKSMHTLTIHADFPQQTHCFLMISL
jgi:hypothetical protein